MLVELSPPNLNKLLRIIFLNQVFAGDYDRDALRHSRARGNDKETETALPGAGRPLPL